MINLVVVIKKFFLRMNSVIKVIIWKVCYLNNVSLHIYDIFYPRTHITIEKRGKLIIGKNCFFNRNCSLNVMESLKIGDNCIFGENVCIYDHNHKFSDKNIIIKNQGYNCKNIVIGDNCWICSNVTILSGVEIGSNSVIGAGCVINNNIPKNSIVRMNNKNIVVEERR